VKSCYYIHLEPWTSKYLSNICCIHNFSSVMQYFNDYLILKNLHNINSRITTWSWGRSTDYHKLATVEVIVTSSLLIRTHLFPNWPPNQPATDKRKNEAGDN